MSTLIKLRRDTAANWAATDPVLALGEPGYDTTNNELRIGDGTSAWSSLTPIAGGGGGASLPLSNGTSNFNIATSGGNATVTTAGTNTWTFDTTGNLTTSSNLLVGPSPAGGSSILQYDSALQVVGEGANAIVVMGWAANTNAPDSIAVVGFNTPYTNGASNVQIAVGNNATTVNYWNFDSTGNLTLPQGGIITEGPSPSYLGNAVTITPASGTDADQQLKIYPTFAEGNHLHLTTGNLYNTEMYVGDDGLYVKLANTGEVVINSNDGVGNTAQWTFDTVGNLTIPAGGAIQTAPGSSGNIYIHPDDGAAVIIQGGASTLLKLTSDTANTQNRFEIDTYGNLGNLGGGVFTGTYIRNGFPTEADDRLASFAGKGSEDGVSVQIPTAAKITLDAAANWSLGSTPTHISFWTTPPAANVPAETVRISPTGNLIVYSGNVVAGNGYVRTGTFTAATLPTGALTQGARAMVSDADSRTWGNLVIGGAGNVVPVWSDGSNWYIG